MKRMSKGEKKRSFIRGEIGVISEQCIDAIKNGTNPVDFLAEKGIENPVQEWYSLRRWMKSCRGDLYSQIPMNLRITLPEREKKEEDAGMKKIMSEHDPVSAGSLAGFEPVTVKRGPGRPRKSTVEPEKRKDISLPNPEKPDEQPEEPKKQELPSEKPADPPNENIHKIAEMLDKAMPEKKEHEPVYATGPVELKIDRVKGDHLTYTRIEDSAIEIAASRYENGKITLSFEEAIHLTRELQEVMKLFKV